MTIDTNTLDEFTRAYIDCALWSSTASGVPEDTGDGTFDTSMESYGFTTEDIAPESLAQMVEDCRTFQETYAELLAQAGDDTQNGHDYWLTRNHHGAGFWDRGYPEEVSKPLTDAAHADSSVDLYVGDDRKVYQS